MMQIETQELTKEQFLSLVKSQWSQGEHMGLIGPTGTGKTHTAQELLSLREWVCVLAVKRNDDTLDRFRNGDRYGFPHYVILRKWPPAYNQKRVVLWAKPESLSQASLRKQSDLVYDALSQIYKTGGWCVYFDEVGYIAGILGLHHELGILLNQGRSSHITVVATMTRPSSVVARVPKESLNQIRHLIIFKYTNRDESDTCAQIAGISRLDMWDLMNTLQFHSSRNGNRFSDCLYFYEGQIFIIRTN